MKIGPNMFKGSALSNQSRVTTALIRKRWSDRLESSRRRIIDSISISNIANFHIRCNEYTSITKLHMSSALLDKTPSSIASTPKATK